MAGDKISVNASSSGSDPSLQSQITTALLQNGGVLRIQSGLQQRLDEAGWSENLRDYTRTLFRSGEATTYDDALAKVMQQIKAEPQKASANGANGTSGVPDLQIPQKTKEGAAETVKQELEKICVLQR